MADDGPDMAAKAAIVAQASQSNDVAFESTPAKSKSKKIAEDKAQTEMP